MVTQYSKLSVGAKWNELERWYVGCSSFVVATSPQPRYTNKEYSIVTIRCKDRPNLFFYTIFTLADMQYVIFHDNVDAEGPVLHQILQFSIRFDISFMANFFLKIMN
uniref:ACT domain-containing protein ACR n=1 Tax=Solanum lycopersicum TaxID=4081 RepID=K4DEQ6_SOLLC